MGRCVASRSDGVDFGERFCIMIVLMNYNEIVILTCM